MRYKGSLQIITESELGAVDGQVVDTNSFFVEQSDYAKHNIEINFERVLLLARAYNQRQIVFEIKPQSGGVKWYDAIFNTGKRVAEAFIEVYPIDVYFLVSGQSSVI
ncbi:hypothetical protein ACR6HW_07045 [Fusibacter sp. JL298sf-3]